MSAFRQHRRWFAGIAFCLFAFAPSMLACAAPPPTSQATTHQRLTVADFMGTWQVFAKSGKTMVPSIEAYDNSIIGKKVTFSRNLIIDNTNLIGRKITINPIYSVNYNELSRDTPYPDIPWNSINKFPYLGFGGIVVFKIGYYSKSMKSITYDYLYVGYNSASLVLIDGDGNSDPDFYLCKINPETGKCIDAPPSAKPAH